MRIKLPPKTTGEGKPIFAYTTDKQTILQLHGNGPWGIKYLDAKDAKDKIECDLEEYLAEHT